MEKDLIASFDTLTREPVISRMKDGSFVCLFLTGGNKEPLNCNVVAISRSYDLGKTWTLPETLFSHSCRGTWSTELFCETEKPFAVVQTYNAPSHYRELKTYKSFTFDCGKTWSEPQSFKGNMDGCSLRKGITLSNGDILFPLYWQEEFSDFDWDDNVPITGMNSDWHFSCGVGISSDGGETWQRYGYISADISLWEPNAVELENGHIIMHCRSCNGFLYTSESFDYGRTWSKAELSDIPNPDTKLTLIKLHGNILLIGNNISSLEPERKGRRDHLCIMKSTDGKKFAKVVNIEDDESVFFYPHAFADEELKTLFVAYENTKEHYLARFSFDELGI